MLWFDALIQNEVDRTWRNPNLLIWRGDLFAIDHGAALYFHHDWSWCRNSAKPFDARQHVVRDRATGSPRLTERLAPLITPTVLEQVTKDVPEEWFGDGQRRGRVRQSASRPCPPGSGGHPPS